MKKILIVVLMLLCLPKTMLAEEQSKPRIYSIIIDRFMNGSEENNKHIHNSKNEQLPLGGDFQGIKGKLDYIKDMGFDTIQISPVFKHGQDDFMGYKVTSYDVIDPVYGGEKQLKALIKAVHKKQMKIIVDMPVTATDEFTSTTRADMNSLQKQYYGDTAIIDLTLQHNQQLYQEKMTAFTKQFNVDGLSMYTLQDNLDAEQLFPAVTTVAVQNRGQHHKNFTYVQKEETTVKLADTFKTTDREIPTTYNPNELLSADQFFMQRFTKYAADENNFPGTRINLLMSYLMIQQHPISMTYGTEIAMNGDQLYNMHQLLDFRTEKEVTDFLKDTSAVYHKYKELYNGQAKVIYNKKGNQLIYFNTDKVDFIYNINNTSKATNVKIGSNYVHNNQMLSGLLIGDSIRQKNGDYHMITNREEAELYAIIKERGLNNWYLVAALSIILAFTTFIVLVARKSKHRK